MKSPVATLNGRPLLEHQLHQARLILRVAVAPPLHQHVPGLPSMRPAADAFLPLPAENRCAVNEVLALTSIKHDM